MRGVIPKDHVVDDLLQLKELMGRREWKPGYDFLCRLIIKYKKEPASGKDITGLQ